MPGCPFTPVLRLPENMAGRDFVVGDIHGTFRLVERALERVRFDPACDRLFCVGDLIDRGPDSPDTVAFLSQPYVHAVCGNHEMMLLDLYAEGEPAPARLQQALRHNGFGWWAATSDEQREDILSALCQLPIVIETRTARGLVGFVHADIPAGMDWPTFTALLQRDDERVLATALWGRQRVHGGDHAGVAGVGRVFVGHTPHGALARYGNVYVVDTGAVFAMLAQEDGRLTIAQTAAATDVMVGAPRLPQIIDARFGDLVPSVPFGAYARPAPELAVSA